MPDPDPRFSRRLERTDERLGSVIVDGADDVLPASPFNLVAGGRVLHCSVAEVDCTCPQGQAPHKHRVLSAEGLHAVIDVRAGNVVVLRREDGVVAVEETAYAVR